MADLKLKLLSSVPASLDHRAVVLVGTSGEYKIYAGDSSNNPVQITPDIADTPVEHANIDDTDSPYTATVGATRSFTIADATNGAITVSLPPLANWADQYITIKKADNSANNVTIEADGAETIDGDGSKILNNQYDYMTIFSDGTSLHVVGSS